MEASLKRRLDQKKATLIIGALPNEPHIKKYKEEHTDEEVYTMNDPDDRDDRYGKANFPYNFNEPKTWYDLEKGFDPFDLIIFDYSVGKFVKLDDELLINTYLYDILKEGGSIYIYDDIDIVNSKEAWVKLQNNDLVKVFCKKEIPPITELEPGSGYNFLEKDLKKYKCNTIRSSRTIDSYYKQYFDDNYFENNYENLFHIDFFLLNFYLIIIQHSLLN